MWDWQHVAALCCAKNRRCDSFRVTPPLICVFLLDKRTLKADILYSVKSEVIVIFYFNLQLNREKNAHDTTKRRLLKNEKQFKQLNRGEQSMTYVDKAVFFSIYM